MLDQDLPSVQSSRQSEEVDLDFIFHKIKRVLEKHQKLIVLADDRSDRELVSDTVTKKPEVLENVPCELLCDRNFVQEILKCNWRVLKHLDAKFLDDPDIITAGMNADVRALEFASERLRGDREFMLRALILDCQCARSEAEEQVEIMPEQGILQEQPRALKYAKEELRRDFQFVHTAVKHNWRALAYAPEEFRRDRGIIMLALEQDWWALGFAAAEFRGDYEVMYELVKKDWHAFKYATPELQRNRDLILVAVERDCKPWKFEMDRSRFGGHTLFFTAHLQEERALKFASEQYRTDRNIVLAAVKSNWRALEYASADLRADRDIVLLAIKQDWWALKYAAEQFRSDREVMLEALMQDWNAWNYAATELQGDRQFIIYALKRARGKTATSDDSLPLQILMMSGEAFKWDVHGDDYVGSLREDVGKILGVKAASVQLLLGLQDLSRDDISIASAGLVHGGELHAIVRPEQPECSQS